MEMRIGVFVGSFDPFTVGHDSVVRRALGLFDRLVIGVVGDQVHKPNMQPAVERMQAIQELYADESCIEVKPYYGLAVDFAKEQGGHYIIKGVSSEKEFEYERERAAINRQSSRIEPILLLSEPQHASAHRSVLRDPQDSRRAIREFLPQHTSDTLN